MEEVLMSDGTRASDTCIVKQTIANIRYSFEYLGNTPRLVVTPLTDKCYMTLTGAIHLNYGGAPAGPAGTGKTETTKDLGKALAVPVIVFNCSDGLDYKIMGRFFSGLAQAGAWACFDEFNRIQVGDFTRVIAQQMLTVTHAIRARKETFEFVGREIPLNPRFGVFITMNPGYAGRAELPDNLKSLFRPVAMMVPDYCLIAEIILYSEGFGSATALARKMVNLYSLSSEQLSKQDHYDFGMRAVKSVLVMAGQLKRKYPTLVEDVTLIRALRDSNVPKFLSFDLPLFFGIISDLYPEVDVPYAPGLGTARLVDYGSLQKEIENQLRLSKLQVVPSFVGKIIQLLETQLVRHGVMVVGHTFIGKSTNIQILSKALSKLRQDLTPPGVPDGFRAGMAVGGGSSGELVVASAEKVHFLPSTFCDAGRIQAATTSRGRFRKDIQEDERLTFGKHNGLTFREALQKDPGYALWCSEQPEASLGMRRFVQYAEDQGAVVAPAPKKQKTSVAKVSAEDSLTSSDSQGAFPAPGALSASLDGFTFQPQPSPVRGSQYFRPSGEPRRAEPPPQLCAAPAAVPPATPTGGQAWPPQQSFFVPERPVQEMHGQQTPAPAACEMRPQQFSGVSQLPPPQHTSNFQSSLHSQQMPETSFHPALMLQRPPQQQQQHNPYAQLAQQQQIPSQSLQPLPFHHHQPQSGQPQQLMALQQQHCQTEQRPQPLHQPQQFHHQYLQPPEQRCSLQQLPPQQQPQHQQRLQPPQHQHLQHQVPASPHLPYLQQQQQQQRQPQQIQQPWQQQPVQQPQQVPQPVLPQPRFAQPQVQPLQSQQPPPLPRTTQSPRGSQSQHSAHQQRQAVEEALKAFDGTFEVELLGRDGFLVRTSKKLPAKVFAAMRHWPGANSAGKRLQFDAASYKKVVQQLLDLCGPEKVQLPPNWVLATVPNFRSFGKVRVSKKVAHVLLADVTGKVLPETAASVDGNEVLPYQREAVNFALRRGGRVLLADEMGLGKTAQALTLCNQFPDDFPLLVVCPSSLRGNWREEAARWLPKSVVANSERHIQVVRKGSDKLRREARVVIVSYDLIAREETFRQSAHGKKYRMVICDEAHYLKTPLSQRSQALRPILQQTRRCALLTGTPALAKASELYSLLDCLLPGLLPDTHDQFCERYCNEKTLRLGRRHVKQWEGSRLGDELYAVLDTVMIRRFKKDVLSQLPPKRRQRVVLEKLSNEQGVLQELREKMGEFQRSKEMGEQGEQGGQGNAAATELFRLTGLAKVEAVAEYVQYLVEAQCRFLLFAHHQAVMDTLQQKLEKLKTGFIRIDGKTPAHHRDQLVNDFRSNPSKQVALLSITACGQGLNLQVCSTVVFAELHWTPGVLLQAEDRAHRMGQQESVNVHYLIARDTLDDSLYQMLERKQHDVGVMVDGQASKIGADNVGSKGTFTKSTLPPKVAEPAGASAAAEPTPQEAPSGSTDDPRQLRLFFPTPRQEASAEDAREDSWVSEPPVSIDVD
ncbi:DNAH6 [Symbiodinium pilosum]|uniref:DNAH6 protein n=1 Tax=Symbiodinium pilosum TaxID=2952 RepID=A0A812LMY6_SYMPI|nr:DNAH6 [Symbiodinium pilosum]